MFAFLFMFAIIKVNIKEDNMKTTNALFIILLLSLLYNMSLMQDKIDNLEKKTIKKVNIEYNQKTKENINI